MRKPPKVAGQAKQTKPDLEGDRQQVCAAQAGPDYQLAFAGARLDRRPWSVSVKGRFLQLAASRRLSAVCIDTLVDLIGASPNKALMRQVYWRDDDLVVKCRLLQTFDIVNRIPVRTTSGSKKGKTALRRSHI